MQGLGIVGLGQPNSDPVKEHQEPVVQGHLHRSITALQSLFHDGEECGQVFVQCWRYFEPQELNNGGIIEEGNRDRETNLWLSPVV